MKKTEKKIICIFLGLISFHFAKAQEFPYNPKKWDVNFTYLKFNETFNDALLDSSKWQVRKDFGRGNCVFVDSVGATYFVTADSILNLKMAVNNGYCFYDYGLGITKCPDYMSAEIVTRDRFKYGIYEGRIKFAGENGSWPAFWFIGNSGAENPTFNNGYASEIDIAEHNWRKRWGISSCSTDHVFHWWWPESIHGSEQMSVPQNLGADKNSVRWGYWHIMKLIYTPYYVKFFIDGNLSFQRSRYYYPDPGNDIDIEELGNLSTYYEYEWFPKHAGNVILSQQVAPDKSLNGSVAVPQTSYFDWVTIRYFFLSPEINLSDFISSNYRTASLDVDTLATGISWSLQPSDFFQTSSGTGKNANITADSLANGQATITYTFYMQGGEQFTTSKDFRVGSPNY